MKKRAGMNPGPKGLSRRPSLATLVTIGAAGTILLLGAGAVYFVARASFLALTTASWVLVTTGLVGLIGMTYILSVRSTFPRRDGGGGGGGAPATRSGPVAIRPTVDPDEELLRILDDARFGDLSAWRARLHNRRPGAA